MTEQTSGVSVNLEPSELGSTIYVEVIIVSPLTGDNPYVVTIGDGGTVCSRRCTTYNGLSFYRAIVTPTDSVGNARTTKSLLTMVGRSPDDYVPYRRNYNTNTLTATTYDGTVANRQSFVFVHNTIGDGGRLRYALEHLSSTREILPSRTVK